MRQHLLCGAPKLLGRDRVVAIVIESVGRFDRPAGKINRKSLRDHVAAAPLGGEPA